MPNNAHLSLFSGIGGLDLAAEWAGFRTVAFVERDKYCQRVLAKHWPGVPIYGDVAEVTADASGEQIGRQGQGGLREISAQRLGIVSGGFPCQPHSIAGKRKASLDERDLWSECARITGEFKPRWAVFENVPGLLSSEGGTFFARVLGDLAALGYRVGWGVWGANDVGALHKRERVFVIAHSNRGGCSPIFNAGSGAEKNNGRKINAFESSAGNENVAHADDQGSQGRERGGLRECPDERAIGPGSAWRTGPIGEFWRAEPQVGRVAHGVPRRVDRLRALGNAVVPQQAYPIFKAIAEVEGING